MHADNCQTLRRVSLRSELIGVRALNACRANVTEGDTKSLDLVPRVLECQDFSPTEGSLKRVPRQLPLRPKP